MEKNIYYLSDFITTNDDSTNFNEAITHIRSNFLEEYNIDNYDELLKNKSTLMLDVSELNLYDTINIPFYIKIKIENNIIINTYIKDKPAIKFSTDTEPDISGVSWDKDIFQFIKNMGSLIEGKDGNIVLRNKLNVNTSNGFMTTSCDNSIGIEIGTTDMTESRLNAYYDLSNIAIINYNIGLKINLVNNYICNFNKIYLIFNNYGVVFGDGNIVNSGEEINFNNCNISNNRVALDINGYININLYNCCIDYNQLCFLVRDVEGVSVFVNGGNMEGFLSKAYIDKYNIADTLLNNEYYGLIYNIRDSKRLMFPVIFSFNNCSISPSKNGVNTIRGIKKANLRNIVSFNNTRISGSGSAENEFYKQFIKNNNTMMNDYITLYSNEIVPSYNGGITLTSNMSNLIENTFLDNATIGESGNYYSNTEIGNIIINNSYGGTAYNIINETILGNNVIELTYDNKRENGCYISFEINQKIEAKKGDMFWFNGLVGFLENGVLIKALTEYDTDNNLLQENTVSSNVTKSPMDGYIPFDYDSFQVNNINTKYIKFKFAIKINELENPTLSSFKVGNFIAMKIN